jgi:hypothetical protein
MYITPSNYEFFTNYEWVEKCNHEGHKGYSQRAQRKMVIGKR